MTAADTIPRRSARKAKGDGHLRRGEILKAAERIFVAEGYEGATIRRIAEEVGVSSTALYMHFPDKACILFEICEQTIRQLYERNLEIAAHPVDPAVRLRRMLEAYMRWGLQHPNAYQLVYSVPRPLSAADWPAGPVDLSRQCYEIFSGVVREIAAAGRLRAVTADAAAQALWMACHGVVALRLSRPNFDWADPEMLLDVSLGALMDGLVAD